MNRVDWTTSEVTHYFNHHEDSRDASDKSHVHHGGDVCSQPSEAVATLLLVVVVWGAGFCGNLRWEVCHDYAALSKTAPTTNSLRIGCSLRIKFYDVNFPPPTAFTPQKIFESWDSINEPLTTSTGGSSKITLFKKKSN